MASLIQMSQRVKGINLQKIYEETIVQEEETILNLNREQLLEGKTNKGQKIKPKYKSLPYANKKKKLNPKAGFKTPDLKLSGGLHSKLELKNKSGVFTFDTDVPYKKYVIPKYDDVLGLSLDSQKIFVNNEFIKEYNEKIRNQMQV